MTPPRGRGRLRAVPPPELSPLEQVHRDLMGIATMFEAFGRCAIPLQSARFISDELDAAGGRRIAAPEPTRQEVAQLVMSTGILRIGLEEFEAKLGAYARTLKR